MLDFGSHAGLGLSLHNSGELLVASSLLPPLHSARQAALAGSTLLPAGDMQSLSPQPHTSNPLLPLMHLKTKA